jgi:hypothetical protein
MSRARSERGQGSVEWVAVVALVTTLLGVGAALAQASSVSRHVTREMARAICLVSRGDCRRDQEPCAVASLQADAGITVSILVVRFGRDALSLVEQRSDGTYAVTVEDGGKLGVAVADGLSAKLKAGTAELSVGGELSASLIARKGKGRTWIVGSMQEALRLAKNRGSGEREPDIKAGNGEFVGAVGASAGVGDHQAAAAGLTFDDQAGWSNDRRTGHRTAYVKETWDATASAGGQSVFGLSGGGETYAVEFDAHGRPVDLRILAAGQFAGSPDLPSVLQPVVGWLEQGSTDGRVYEVTSHLDLTDADNLVAARGLLDAIAAKRATARPSQALRRRLDERGTVEARVLAQHAATAGLGAEVTVEGLRLGADVEARRQTQQLVAAVSRGLDGQWLTRADCVAGA